MTRRAWLATAPYLASAAPPRRTEVAIHGARFFLNGRPTYEGRVWEGMKIEGLLLNSRMVQGIFDDLNPHTAGRWKYPDTGRWDPQRNTREFVAAMPSWRAHGLLAFTLNLQGGSPQGYSKEQPWRNSAINPDGSLRPDYLARLKLILDRADSLGMVVILGYFYFGQDEHLRDDGAVRTATQNATRWLRAGGWRNILVEIANECDNRSYERASLRAAHIHSLIESVRAAGLPAGASFNGGSIPTANVVRASDFLLLHGNGVGDPARIAAMVEQARRVAGYRPMPVLFNEDDHFAFDQPANNMRSALAAYASWGYFDPGASDYADGYQCPPVNWTINTARKKAFFAAVRRCSGA